MKIITNVEGRVRYYVTTSNARPVLGDRLRAAELPPERVERVLAHLRQIDHRFAEAEVVP